MATNSPITLRSCFGTSGVTPDFISQQVPSPRAGFGGTTPPGAWWGAHSISNHRTGRCGKPPGVFPPGEPCWGLAPPKEAMGTGGTPSVTSWYLRAPWGAGAAQPPPSPAQGHAEGLNPHLLAPLLLLELRDLPVPLGLRQPPPLLLLPHLLHQRNLGRGKKTAAWGGHPALPATRVTPPGPKTIPPAPSRARIQACPMEASPRLFPRGYPLCPGTFAFFISATSACSFLSSRS